MTTLYTSVNKIHLQITRHVFPEPNLSTWMVQKHTSCIFPQQQKIFRKLFVSTKVNSLNPVKVKVAQSCPTLCNTMDYTVHAVGSLSLLQGIFPTQGLNPGLPHCRWILYQLSQKGSPELCLLGKTDTLKKNNSSSYWKILENSRSPLWYASLSSLKLSTSKDNEIKSKSCH